MRAWSLLPVATSLAAATLWVACDDAPKTPAGAVVPLDAGPEENPGASADQDARADADDTVPFDATTYERDAAAPAPQAVTCAAYCDGYGTRCGFAGTEIATDRYLSKAACLAACGATPAGDPSIVNGDTLACRAGTYAAEGETPCAAGGPFGLYGASAYDAGPDADPEAGAPPSKLGQVACGKTACATFCALAVRACVDAGASSPSWNGGFDERACLATCGNDFAFDRDAGAACADDGRNTLNCRMYQLQLALTDPSKCPRLGAGDDAGVCVH